MVMQGGRGGGPENPEFAGHPEVHDHGRPVIGLKNEIFTPALQRDDAAVLEPLRQFHLGDGKAQLLGRTGDCRYFSANHAGQQPLPDHLDFRQFRQDRKSVV